MNLHRSRWLNALLLSGSTSILVLAAWLSPNPEGLGTHTALGLSPCVVWSALGVPCPMCGVTTTFSLMADFRPLAALINQPFGVVLFVITVGIAMIAGMEVCKPNKRWVWLSRQLLGREVAFVGLLFVTMITAWVYKVVITSNFLSGLP